MRISILVKPNARHEKVEKIGEREFRVSVKVPPTEGKANQAVIKLLARHFDVPPSSIQIISGLKGKKKWVEVG